MNDRQIEVLLVDDDSDEYVIIRDLAAAISSMEIHVDHVAAYDEAKTVIEQNRHDVYLIDYRLGPHSGLDLVRDALQRGCTRPLFILTGQGDYEIDVQASELGATGYLEKDGLDSVLLERSIRYGLGTNRMARDGSAVAARPGDLQLQIALARGATVRDAAKAAGVAERTAHRRLNDPSFRAEVDRLREELRLKIVENVAAQLSNEHFSESDVEGSPTA
jgi:FixJ family two-component response regulator